MLKLEDIKVGAQIEGLVPGELAEVIAVNPVGADALTVIYKAHSGALHDQLVYRSSESSLSLAKTGLAWSFDSPNRSRNSWSRR